MAIGRRQPQQAAMFIPATQIARGPGHPFYTKLNEVLAQAQFDAYVEQLCVPYYTFVGLLSEPGEPSRLWQP